MPRHSKWGVLHCVVDCRRRGLSPQESARECGQMGADYVDPALVDILDQMLDGMLQKLEDADRRGSVSRVGV